MNAFERYQSLIIMAAVLIGLMIGGIPVIQMYAGIFIIPFLMVMLYGLFIMMPFNSIVLSLGNIRFLGTSLFINFIWTPILAYGIGMLFLSDHPLLLIGFIMLMVTPCTDWYLVFTDIAKGNTALSTSLLPINLTLQIILLPVYLYLFFGTYESVGLKDILESILLVLAVPMVFAAITKKLLNNRDPDILEKKFSPFFEKFNIIFLSLAVMAMFASERASLIGNPEVVLLLFIPVMLFFGVAFLVSILTSRLMKFNHADSVSLTMTTMARNSPIALAIAVTAFSGEPFIALALVIGPLIELPMLALTAQVLLRLGEK